MTMRNRRPLRPTTSRRENVFVSSPILLTLGNADTGVAGQIRSTTLDTAIEARLGRNLGPGDTISRIWVHGFWGVDSDVAVPVAAFYHLGIGFFPAGIDAGDYPDLAAHEGNYLLHDGRPLVEVQSGGAVVAQALLPLTLSSLILDNKSQRTVRRSSDQLHMVVQKSAATEHNVALQIAVTCMWKPK